MRARLNSVESICLPSRIQPKHYRVTKCPKSISISFPPCRIKSKDWRITHRVDNRSEIFSRMGSEAAATAVEVAAEKQLHKLRNWTFWFDNKSKPKQGAAWGTSLRKDYSFNTVQEFWWIRYLVWHEAQVGRPSLLFW